MNKCDVTPKKRAGARAWKRGRWAEALGALFLRIKGYKILEKRYKTNVGELDIITRKNKTIIAVEVKYRPTYEQASTAISPKQCARIERALQLYLLQHPKFQNHGLRLDALFLCPWRFPQHLKNAWWQVT